MQGHWAGLRRMKPYIYIYIDPRVLELRIGVLCKAADSGCLGRI